jgi:hypothetical protein
MMEWLQVKALNSSPSREGTLLHILLMKKPRHKEVKYLVSG